MTTHIATIGIEAPGPDAVLNAAPAKFRARGWDLMRRRYGRYTLNGEAVEVRIVGGPRKGRWPVAIVASR